MCSVILTTGLDDDNLKVKQGSTGRQQVVRSRLYNLSLHRSGTQSTHDLMVRSGLKSIHYPREHDDFEINNLSDIREENLRNIIDSISRTGNFDHYSDLPYPLLYNYIADSDHQAKFYVVIRNICSWIKSVRIHTRGRKFTAFEKCLYWRYIDTHPECLDDISDTEMALLYIRHYELVLSKFGKSENFSLFYLEDPEVGPKLCAFANIMPRALRLIDYKKNLAAAVRPELEISAKTGASIRLGEIWTSVSAEILSDLHLCLAYGDQHQIGEHGRVGRLQQTAASLLGVRLKVCIDRPHPDHPHLAIICFGQRHGDAHSNRRLALHWLAKSQTIALSFSASGAKVIEGPDFAVPIGETVEIEARVWPEENLVALRVGSKLPNYLRLEALELPKATHFSVGVDLDWISPSGLFTLSALELLISSPQREL